MIDLQSFNRLPIPTYCTYFEDHLYFLKSEMYTQRLRLLTFFLHNTYRVKHFCLRTEYTFAYLYFQFIMLISMKTIELLSPCLFNLKSGRVHGYSVVVNKFLKLQLMQLLNDGKMSE